MVLRPVVRGHGHHGRFFVFLVHQPPVADHWPGGNKRNLPLNIIVGVLLAVVVGWALYTWHLPTLRNRLNRHISEGLCAMLAAAFGAYILFTLETPLQLHIFQSPVIGLFAAVTAGLAIYRAVRFGSGDRALLRPLVLLGAAGVIALGVYCASLVAGEPGSILYLSWAMGALLAGATGLAIYRSIYFYLRKQARSPLVMLVGSLGLLLSITAFISIIFSPDGRPLAEPFGSVPWSFGGAYIKPFQVFIIGAALAVFAGLALLLNRTSFGMAVRAIGDDEASGPHRRHQHTGHHRDNLLHWGGNLRPGRHPAGRGHRFSASDGFAFVGEGLDSIGG